MRGMLSVSGVVTLVMALVLGWASAPRAEAAEGLWPNRGELCWSTGVPDEGYLRAYTKKLLDNHYSFQGAVYRAVDVPGGADPRWEVQPFTGSVVLEVYDSTTWAIANIAKFQVNDTGRPGYSLPVLEGFSGILWFDVSSLEGTMEGIIYTCDRDVSPPDYSCEMRNGGPATFFPIPCP